MPHRILLADDHTVFRQMAKGLLEGRGFVVVGEAANGREAVRMAQQLDPDLALVDLKMPVLNGVDTAREILQRSSTIRVIALTVHRTQDYVLAALRAGARGYILKSRLGDDLDQAIEEVFRGGIWVTAEVRSAAVEDWIAGLNLS